MHGLGWLPPPVASSTLELLGRGGLIAAEQPAVFPPLSPFNKININNCCPPNIFFSLGLSPPRPLSPYAMPCGFWLSRREKSETALDRLHLPAGRQAHGDQGDRQETTRERDLPGEGAAPGGGGIGQPPARSVDGELCRRDLLLPRLQPGDHERVQVEGNVLLQYVFFSSQSN